MMARSGPSHTKKNFKAQHVFTDRDEPRKAFADALAKQQSNKDYRILNFYGIGGQGKTALCEQFTLKLEEEKKNNKKLGWAKLDFENSESRMPANALLAIRLQLADSCNIHFPAFDLAFARYFSFSRKGQNIQDAHPDLFKGANDILQDIEGVAGDVIDEVPGIGLIYKYLKKLSTKTKNWWQRQGKEVLKDLDSLEQHKLLDQLPKYLGADIYDWLFNEKAQQALDPHRIVILLDTYEALWRNEPTKKGVRSTGVDKWVRKLGNETPGVLFVMLGRDKLNWPDEWQADIELHLLGGLSDDDADKFLRQVPIEEDQIRSTIIKSSQGLPFYLDLQVDLYEDLKQTNPQPDIANFGGKEEEILTRFTNHISDSAYQALQIASYPRFINEEMLQLLAEEFLGGKASININELTDYSFWRKQNQNWSLHALMRDYMQQQETKDNLKLYQQIHEFLFKTYDSRLESLQQVIDIKERHAIDLEEASYHHQQFNSEGFPEWAGNRGQLFYQAYAWQIVEPLLNTAIFIGKKALGKDHPDVAASLNSLAGLYRQQGKYEQAEPLYQRSLPILEKALGKDHPGVATSLNNLAGLYKSQGKYEQAEPLYQRSLSILEKALGEEHPDVAASLNNLAELYRQQGKYEQAEPLHQRSFSIREKALGKDHLDVATSMNNLALLYDVQGRYGEAEPLYQRSLFIVEKVLGKDHPKVATSLNNLALLYNSQDKYEQAEPLYQRSLPILEKALGKDHPGVATSLNNLAGLYKSQGKYEQAEPLYQRSFLIWEKALGKDHPNVAASLNNLAGLYKSQGKYEQAEPLYQQAFVILKAVFPDGHPNLVTLKGNVEYLKKRGRSDMR